MSVSTGERLDLERDGRALPTVLHLPAAEPPWPLAVFAHGWMGHPRKFSRLFRRWTAAGLALAAPTFPYTNEASSGKEMDDVRNQPADLRFVRDRLLADGRFDAERVVLAGFSLGAKSALAAAFDRVHRGPRPAAVVSISGRWPEFADCAPADCPLLVVHGRRDDVVPYEVGLDVYARAVPPKALLTIELPTHAAFVQDEPPTEADAVVPDVSTAFLARLVCERPAPRPEFDPALARLDSEGIW